MNKIRLQANACVRYYTEPSQNYRLRNGPDKNDSNNGNKSVGMQKRC